MSEAQCWRCGNPVALTHNRSDVCGACGSDLYCCRMCRAYAPSLHRKCRDDRAEPPRDADRANFCDWLEVNPQAFQGGDAAADAARTALEDLFKTP